MKFLADMNILLRTVQWLRERGFDAIHLREENLHKELDANILIKARIEQRILLTMDLDFGYLLAVSGEKLPSIILFRLKNETSEVVNAHLIIIYLPSLLICVKKNAKVNIHSPIYPSNAKKSFFVQKNLLVR